MTTSQLEPSLGDYLRKRLMPVEGAIPHLPGIEMYGNSIPAELWAATFLSTLIFNNATTLPRVSPAPSDCPKNIWSLFPKVRLRETRLTIRYGG